MTRDDIVAEFNRLPDDHVVWRRGHWDHRSYKLAFFKLFRTAYEEGFLRLRGHYAPTGERVREEIIETHITMASPKNTYKLGLLQQMCIEWDASAPSRYAWDMDPARKITSTGRWKNTQELAAMPPTGKKQ
jgi:hypothetical protein